MKASLSSKGIEEYLEALAQADGDVDQAAKKSLSAGAEVALEGMERRVAVLTGNLKSKLKVGEPEQDGNVISIDIGLLDDTDEETARYGNVQEFGSSTMPAHPYIRPTMAEDKFKITAAMRKSLEEQEIL
ncbi:MAG: HK97-gp10 family putative phage morphogenesis protein [Anaerolineaceae bacterium]